MLVAVLCHPFGTCQVALPDAPRSLRFAHRIDVQHDARHFPPIGTFGISIEEPKISREMLAVISRQDVSVGRLVGNAWFG